MLNITKCCKCVTCSFSPPEGRGKEVQFCTVWCGRGHAISLACLGYYTVDTTGRVYKAIQLTNPANLCEKNKGNRNPILNHCLNLETET